MRAALKFIMIAVGLALIGLTLAAIVFSIRFEDVLRAEAQDRLSHILGVDVTLESIRLAPVHKGVKIMGLTVENPPSFKQGSAVVCERVVIMPQLRSVFSRTPTIKKIVMEGTRVNLRYEVGEGTNLGHLSKQARNLAETQGGKTGWFGARQIRVREFTCSGAKMQIRSMLTAEVPISLNIAPFTIEELSEDTPVSPAKLSSIVLRSLVMEVITLKGLLRPVKNLLEKEVA